jgi:hypothetical protein
MKTQARLSTPPPDESPEANPLRSRHALLAIGAAAAVLVIVLLLAFRGGGRGEFPGDDEVAAAIRASRKIDAASFEPVGMPAGKVGDWFLTKGFEDYRVPAGLTNLQVAGAALAEQDGTAIAVLQLEESGRRVSVFATEPHHIKLEPEGSWMVYDLPAGGGGPRLAVAAHAEQGVLFAVFSPESPDELRRWLDGRGLKLR